MKYFLIDYENTGENGLKGILELDEDCCVVIFYSENADKLSFDMHQKLTRCRTKLDFRKINTGKKNALDFQLSTYLGFLIAQCDTDSFYIVSKDNGYRAVVDFWKEKKVRQIDYVGRATAKPLLIEAKQQEVLDPAAPEEARQESAEAETAQQPETPAEQARTPGRSRRGRHGRRRSQDSRAQEPEKSGLTPEEEKQLSVESPADTAKEPKKQETVPEELPFTDGPKTEPEAAEAAPAEPKTLPAVSDASEAETRSAEEKEPVEKPKKRGRRSSRARKQEPAKEVPEISAQPEALAAGSEPESAAEVNPKPEFPAEPEPAAPEAAEPEAKPEEPEHKKKTHRGGRRKKAKEAPVDEFAPGEELRAQVAQLIDEKEAQEQIGRFIVKYKTKQGVNNAIVKLYGTEKAGELYKKIKPLLKDKKGK